MSDHDRLPIRGSARRPVAGHERVQDADGGETASVSVYLRPRAPFAEPAGREPLARADWAAAHGAAEQDIDAVKGFATAYHLQASETDPARRMVRLTGRLGDLMEAFGVEDLAVYRHLDGSTYRGRSGELTVPASLAGVIEGVFGIDDRSQAKPHFRLEPAAAAHSYTPIQVAEAYSFPTGYDGEGETVAIIELGGGYREQDLATYFAELGVPAPNVSAVAVNGGSNAPGAAADAEVMLDIEVVGAVAPGAEIVVYFAPNSGDVDFIDAVSQAVHDTRHNPSVVSISWGGPEDTWSAQARAQMEQVIAEAAALGVTVTVAAGDNGSSDGVEDGLAHVDFPASAPHALACGGTSLVIDAGQIASERTWNEPGGGATGGGISIEFPLSAPQKGVVDVANVDTHKAGRGVPDVAGDAAPGTGYQVRVDGSDTVVGGTSAVAPLWAGLVARLNEALGKPVGYLQPQLYELSGTDAFHDITKGGNGSYSAFSGWDACTGLGSPNGENLLSALKGAAATHATGQIAHA
jgi:kumamolisin